MPQECYYSAALAAEVRAFQLWEWSVKRIYLLGFMFLVGLSSMAQELPKIEVAGGYSYMNFTNPQLTSQNLNGGGGAFVTTLRIGWASRLSSWATPLEPAGQISCASWATPVLPVAVCSPTSLVAVQEASGKPQPFGEVLYGGAHSGGYASALRAKGDGTYVLKSGGSGQRLRYGDGRWH